jgi:cytoskeletal protein CcmA (bactofilin family)
MAQIIKHRRGSLSQLKDVTARVGELVMATGSIGDLNGPIVFIGETEGSAGSYRPVSKIYQGTTVPTITVGSYGSTIDGTPFYASTNKTLYILSKDGNVAMDLVGNIEGNTISNVTITSLTGSQATFDTYVSSSALNVTGNTQIGQDLVVGGDTFLSGNLNITGNTIQTGSISLTGDVKLGGNIFIGDNPIEDVVVFASNISSSLVPSDNNTFDIGSPENSWKDLYVSGTAYINNIQLDTIQVDSLALPGNLTVSGTTTLSGSVLLEDLTNNRVVIVGTNGQLEDDANFVFDGDKLNIGEGDFEVDVVDGDIRTSGSLLVTSTTELKDSVTMNSTLTVTGSVQLKSTLEVVGNTSLNGTLTVTGSATLKDTLTVNSTTELKGDVGINSTLNVTGSAQFKSTIDVDGQAAISSLNVEDLTENRVVVVGLNGELEDDANFVFDGNKLNIGQGNFEVDVVDGDIRTSGSFTVQDLNVVNNLNVGNNLTITGTTSMLGDLFVSGNVSFLGSATEVIISSSTVMIDDNIITLNAFSPFERYAGFEVIDSGSTGVSASLLWDSQNDYWMFVSSSGQSSKLIGTTPGTYGTEIALTINRIPKATGISNIGDSLLSDNGTVLSYNTNKFTVNSDSGETLISGNVTLSSSGGNDTNTKTSAIVFKNSSNILGYVPTTETTDVMDGILGYKQSNGGLVFSTVIDGGTY